MTTRENPEERGGDVSVGRFVLHFGDLRGAELQEAASARFRRRPTPTLILPKSIPGLIGREAELSAIISALDAGIPVEISGGPGTGKTALLRCLAHRPRAGSFPDGVLYLSARQQTVLDLQQRLFEAFYESDPIALATDAEVRRALRDAKALIILDDVSLSPHDAEQILAVAPRCAFVVATRDRRLWSEVRNVALDGLSAKDAVLLLERELEQSIGSTATLAATSLCQALAGHPLRLQQAAAIIRERGLAVDEWDKRLTPESLTTELLTSIDERDRRLLLALAALPGTPVEAQHVAGMAESTDVEASLLALARRGLVLRHDARYGLADGVADRLRRTDDLYPWVNRAITYFVAWAERHRRSRESLLQASDALLRVQEHALEAKRWGEALRVGRLLEAALVLGSRWGAWGIALERSLIAIRALGDRSAESGVLHHLGTRAVCLEDAGTARRMLAAAAALRDQLGEAGAATVSRANLKFVVPERVVAERVETPAQKPSPMPFDDVGDVAPLVVPAYATAARRGALMSEGGAILITFLLCGALGAFAYTALSGQWSAFLDRDSDAGASPVPRSQVTAASPPLTVAPAAAPQTLEPPATERASILIFTARPGSIVTRFGPTSVCYAVRDALETRIEPGIGDVDAAPTLTCRRVAARTATYELTAVGRDGVAVKQQLVIVAR